jgi:hypothetical protein
MTLNTTDRPADDRHLMRNPRFFARAVNPLTVVMIVSALTAATVVTAGAAGPDAVVDDAGCTTSTLAGTNDGSTELVPLGFSANYFGSTYSAVYVNNNGDVTFGMPYAGFSGPDLTVSGRPIIAVALSDVDTRPAATTPVQYGITTYGGRPAFCVNWVDVGYFDSGVDELNSSQLVLVDRSDTGAGNFDIVMNYDRLVHESVGGLTAGYSDGATVSYTMPGSGTPGALVDANEVTGLVHGSAGSSQLGRYVFPVRDGDPSVPVLQVISFDQPADATYGDPPFTVTATSTSGLTVALAASGSCTVTDATVTITHAGWCTLTATQPGDGANAPALPVVRTFVIDKAPVGVALGDLAQVYDGTARVVTVTTTPPGVGTATIWYAESVVPPIDAGSYSVMASVFGPDHFGSAAGVLTVAKAVATIAIGDTAQPWDGTPRAVAVSTTPAGLGELLVTYDGSSTPPTEMGAYAVVATLTNGNYTAAASATLVVGPVAQSIELAALSDTTYGAAGRALVASSSSGLPVRFTTSGPCTTDGSVVTATGAGTCVVTASQDGDADTAPAPSVSRSFAIAPAAQSITFRPVADAATFGDAPIPLLASATSGLPVTFATEGPCDASTGQLVLTGAGACTVTAVQRGTRDWTAATGVDQPVDVARGTATITLADLQQVAGVGPRPVTVTTDPADLEGVTVTYDGDVAAPEVAGRYHVVATADDPDYVAAPVEADLVLTRSPAPSSPGPPAPVTGPPAPVTGPTGGGLSPGQTQLLVGGAPVGVQMSLVGDHVVVTGPEFRVSISATGVGDQTTPLSASGTVQLTVGRWIEVSGTGFAAGSTVEFWLFSTPQWVGTTTVDDAGAFTARLSVPPDLEVGDHTLQMNGSTQTDEQQSLSLSVGVTASDSALAASADEQPDLGEGSRGGDDSTDEAAVSGSGTGEGAGAGDSEASGGGELAGLAPYDPASEPEVVVGSQVAVFALLAVAGGGMTTLVGSGGATVARDEGRRSIRITAAKVKHYKFRWEGEAAGDGSRSWSWRGTDQVDALSRQLPVSLARHAPFLARIVTDGAYLRAMFGPLALLAPVVGALLGLVAAIDTGGEALPPAFWILLCIVLLGIVDAGAGFATTLAFTTAVVVTGGVRDINSVFTLLGLAALCFAPPLIASAARPFRRVPPDGTEDRWKRIGDYVIAPLIGAWAVQKMVGALPGLAELQVPVAAHADAIAISALAAIVVRLALESASSHWYPARLVAVSPEKIPFSTVQQRYAATLVRTAVFLVVSSAFVGNCWQLWTAAGLFMLPQLLKIHENTFTNRPRIYAVLPRGITKTVIMLFLGRWFATVLLRGIDDPVAVIRDGLILLSLPGLAISLVDLVARDGNERPAPGRLLVWAQHLAGGALVAVGIGFVLGRIG